MKNREIKFRAWDGVRMIDDNTGMGLYEARVMHDSVWYYEESGDVFYWHECDGGYQFMQYTGLKDKNGVEIYEGDIVHCFDDTPTDPVIPITDVNGVVVYTEHGYMLDCGEDMFALQVNYGYIEHIEVIGNVHEHPHLLA